MEKKMATQVHPVENRFPQRILQADGLAELIFGAALLVDSATVGRWLNVNAELVLITGIGVILYGAWLLYTARQNVSRPTLGIVAILNIAFPIVSVALLALDWNAFTNEGRWLV